MLEEIWRRIYFSNLAVLLKQILVHTRLSIAVESVSSLYKCSPKQGIYFNLLKRTRNNVGHIAKISDILHKSSCFWINSWSKNEIYIIYIWYPRSLLKKRYIYLLFKLPENQPHLFACQTDFFLSQMAWLHNCMGLFFFTQVSEIYLNYKLYSFTPLCKQIKMHACFLYYASVYITRNLFFSRANVTSILLLSLFHGFL